MGYKGITKAWRSKYDGSYNLSINEGGNWSCFCVRLSSKLMPEYVYFSINLMGWRRLFWRRA